jgi:hypothetical protein
MGAFSQLHLPRRRDQLDSLSLESDLDFVAAPQPQRGPQAFRHDHPSGIIDGSSHAIEYTGDRRTD